MQIKIQLVSAPYEEPGTNPNFPDWPTTRCDGLLINSEGEMERHPPALIQLASNGRIKQPLPAWREGDTAILTPLVIGLWNDVQETGRCYLDLYLRVTCEGREGWLDMIPRNPNFYDFTKEPE
jgi:hypothetical protein